MADQSPRHLVLLPAMLCDEDLYRAQIAALGDLVESLPLVVAEAGMAESAAAVLRRAPARFVLAGTSYGASLALEVAVTAPTRVLGLWLMGCRPGCREPSSSSSTTAAICRRSSSPRRLPTPSVRGWVRYRP
jgi:pimeloyl-ACP methyl ester carboxylesterase